ncbi:MAG TPA: hypothetical protein VG759_08990 [Candidatus Angelobacter sp.]|jgi:hypothetical protein|nr:hypothetical protein [Candidatus Angelobacter sp.]
MSSDELLPPKKKLPEKDAPSGGLGTEIAALFAGCGLDSDIPEIRGYEVKPAEFEP